MQQQRSGPRGLVIEDVALPVAPDVQVQQEDLAVLQDTEGIGQVCASFTQRLDLRSRENDAGLPGVEDFVVVTRTLVPRDHFDWVV